MRAAEALLMQFCQHTPAQSMSGCFEESDFHLEIAGIQALGPAG